MNTEPLTPHAEAARDFQQILEERWPDLRAVAFIMDAGGVTVRVLRRIQIEQVEEPRQHEPSL